MKITKIDRASLWIVNNRILAALKPLEAELGVTFSLDKSHYSNGAVGDVVVKFACSDAAGGAQSADKIAFERNARFFGLQPSDFGRKFRHGGEIFEIVGIRPKAHRYPITVESSSGRKAYPADTVKSLLGSAAA